MNDVVLGPASELHRGVHGTLVDSPPPGVRYVDAPHAHRFRFAGSSRGARDPFREHAAGEFVEYRVPPGLVWGVHSSRLPVAGRLPWVADVDCLVTTLRYGRPFLLGTNGSDTLGQVGPDALRRRERIMLRQYLGARCKGLLFRTEHARRTALGYITDEQLLDPRELDAFAARLDVVHPTVRPGRSRPLAASTVTVVYAGRTFEDKGGALAISALASLVDLPVRPVWVGAGPVDMRAALPGVELHEWLPRAAWLELLGRADVLVSPTEFESYGMALVEGAACGAAIVTTSGPGMEHIGELFEEGVHALFVDNRLGAAAKLAALTRHVRALVERPELRRAMQAANRALFTHGRLSLARRDATLLARYARFDDPIGPDAESCVDDDSVVVPAAAIRALYRRHSGGQPRRVLVR